MNDALEQWRAQPRLNKELVIFFLQEKHARIGELARRCGAGGFREIEKTVRLERECVRVAIEYLLSAVDLDDDDDETPEET